MRIHVRHINAALMVSIGACLLLSVSRAKQADPNILCINRIRSLDISVALYTQDYDDRFPFMKSIPKFQGAVKPYLQDPSVTLCPATGLAYHPNAALDLLPEASVSGDHGKIRVLQDAKPHADGKSTIIYLDGRITRGGVDVANPEYECISFGKQLGLAVLLYTQDYDEQLPPMHHYDQFKKAIYPYLNDARMFDCPATKRQYKLNAALSGVNLITITQPSTTVLLTDSLPHADGTVTTVYVDGHVVQQ